MRLPKQPDSPRQTENLQKMRLQKTRIRSSRNAYNIIKLQMSRMFDKYCCCCRFYCHHSEFWAYISKAKESNTIFNFISAWWFPCHAIWVLWPGQYQVKQIFFFYLNKMQRHADKNKAQNSKIYNWKIKLKRKCKQK